MPPTSFAETSIDEEAIVSDTVADEESILSECVNAQVPRQWLSWHYRSQSERLIAFSNHRYYAGRLSTFPGPRGPKTNAPASISSGFTANSCGIPRGGQNERILRKRRPSSRRFNCVSPNR